MICHPQTQKVYILQSLPKLNFSPYLLVSIDNFPKDSSFEHSSFIDSFLVDSSFVASSFVDSSIVDSSLVDSFPLLRHLLHKQRC